MKRKKQGASLIAVVVVFMFIFTVSTAMLSMVASNYKARIAESKRVENLYASDSGLDVAYNIIGKTFDAATKYANLKVTQLENIQATDINVSNDTSIYNTAYKDISSDIKYFQDDINITLPNWNATHSASQQKTPSEIESAIAKDEALIKEDENMQETLCNEEFKRSFCNFIKVHTYKDGDPKYDENDDANQDRLGTNEEAPNELETLINSKQYISDVSDIDNFTEETVKIGIENKNNEEPTLETTVTESPIVGTSYPTTGISESNNHHYDVSFTVYGDQYFDIAVKSTFYTENVNGNETNQRQLQAAYRMLVPNYKDIYFQNSNGNLNEYLATKDRALTIFGNMNVNNANGLSVAGDIFVQGSDDLSSTDRVYGKYFGGITLNNSGGVNFANNVITRGTFNIQNTTTPAGVTATTNVKNLYARNIYIGKIDNSDGVLASGVTSLNITNEAIINNDLALNADNATIKLKDLYGINDENINAKAQSSSSIIVNGNNNSSINITGSAYLMGTAHIATAGDYQTAESGAIKGNYIAYSIPLTDEQKNKYGITGTEQFIYDNPLQLLYPTDPATAQQEKELHFRAYWDGGNPNAGGIIWPHNADGTIDQKYIWSSGVIVYKKNNDSSSLPQVIPSHYSMDLENQGQPVYQKRVEFAQYVYKFGQNADISDYDNGTVTPNISLIDTSKIPSTYVLGNQSNKGEYAIFNGDDTKEIKITKSTTGDDVINTNDPNVINIQVGNGGVLHAVIATAGKVSIESGITIDGCIIAKGDLNIDGDGVTINYDSGVIERVEARNVDTFNAVFGSSIVADTNNNTNGTSGTGSTATNYNLKNFLENKLWKILK
ncbi:hypothetical protein [Clostridium sp.]|uniref:hypothetical protein n=1 Tax=Clostridium sp. TaxID=1506 RepID=UPI00260D06FB|nr:hypothetical protein [Clostridium sp.]